jgi:hypothetical protein
VGEPTEGSVWADDCGITWESASSSQREEFALQRLFWFFRMVDCGGPDGSELDAEVYELARQAVEWFAPIYERRADAAGMGSVPCSVVSAVLTSALGQEWADRILYQVVASSDLRGLLDGPGE